MTLKTLLAQVCLLLVSTSLLAQEAPLLLTDGTGKEHKIKAWKWVAGTRHLAWLAPATNDQPTPKEVSKKPPALGPEALEFREEQSTNFVDGVLTLVPLERLRGISYDEDKQTVTVKVATTGKIEDDVVLIGSTRYRGINKLTLEAEVDKGELGVAAVKFLGGVPKGMRSVQFPNPKAADAAPRGRLATITLADKDKTTQQVADLQPLYRLSDGSERLLPTLTFKKTLKLDMNKIHKVQLTEAAKGAEAEWIVTLVDGEETALSLLKTIPLGEQPATLVGLLGRVSAGYKLYPPHTLSAISFEEAKKE